jgi:hypothetical protein
MKVLDCLVIRLSGYDDGGASLNTGFHKTTAERR